MIAWERRAPSAPAAGAADRVWAATATAAVRHRVLPDGCVDLVATDDGRVLVVGPALSARLVSLAPGAPVHGVRLRPGVAGQVLGLPVGELLGATVALDAVSPALGWELERALAGGRDVVDGLERVLAARGPGTEQARRASAVVAHLAAAGGRPVTQVAGEMGLSERQLRRWCRDHCGHAPAELRRVLRLQALLRCAAERPAATLAELAVACGFHDQQHMSREVRRLAGTTPGRLLRRDGRSVQDAAGGGA